MPDIPKEAVQAAAQAIAALYEPSPDSWETEARAALEAALPYLYPSRKPRMTCPVCGRDVVRRDDGTPTTHYPPKHDPAYSCEGTLYSRCRGGCRCRKHR